ncbi:MAG: hypothetical protein Q9175_004461 [Cornicularia normoerica]
MTLSLSPNALRSTQKEANMKFLFSTFSSVGYADSFPAIATERSCEATKSAGSAGFPSAIGFRHRRPLIPWSSPTCDADVTPGKLDAATRDMAASVSQAFFVDPVVEQVEDYMCALKE